MPGYSACSISAVIQPDSGQIQQRNGAVADLPKLIQNYVQTYVEEMKASFRMEIEASQQQKYAAIHSHLLDVKNEIQVHLDNISRKFDNLVDRISAVEESVKTIQQELADMPSPSAASDSATAAQGSHSYLSKRSRKNYLRFPYP